MPAEVGAEVGDGDELFALSFGEDEGRDGDSSVAGEGGGGEGVLAHKLGHVGVRAGFGPLRIRAQALRKGVLVDEAIDLFGALSGGEV